jgi:transposase-like protein
MIQQRRFTKELEEEAVRLVQTSGRTQREIAGDLGIGLQTRSRRGAQTECEPELVGTNALVLTF